MLFEPLEELAKVRPWPLILSAKQPRYTCAGPLDVELGAVLVSVVLLLLVVVMSVVILLLVVVGDTADGRVGNDSDGRVGKTRVGNTMDGNDSDGRVGNTKVGNTTDGKVGNDSDGKVGKTRVGNTTDGRVGNDSDGRVGKTRVGNTMDGNDSDGRVGNTKVGNTNDGNDSDGRVGKTKVGNTSDGRVGKTKVGNTTDGRVGNTIDGSLVVDREVEEVVVARAVAGPKVKAVQELVATRVVEVVSPPNPNTVFVRVEVYGVQDCAVLGGLQKANGLNKPKQLYVTYGPLTTGVLQLEPVVVSRFTP